ncbi:MAG: (d)CMP kinase [Candidatus Izemoplasma sp.]
MKRIVILGPSGTGKTTLGRNLSEKLNIKALPLDSVYWKKNWSNISKPEFNIYMHKFLIKNNSWIIDGNYSNHHHLKYRLDLADTIIILDYGVKASLKGILERARKFKNKTRSDMPTGCTEGVDQEFLQYTVFYTPRGRMVKAKALKYKNKKQVIVFKNRQELNNWFHAL